MALISLVALNVFFFLRGKHPPKRGCQHLRRERLVKERHAPRSHGFERTNIDRITARCQDPHGRVTLKHSSRNFDHG